MGYRVLMVDDDSRFTTLVSEYFRKNGIAMTCAGGEKEAMRLFGEQQFDLVLLDVMMSRLNEGYDICDEIRRQNADIPVIFLTARGDVRDQELGFNLGAHDYVVKPYSERVLLLKVKTMLDRAGGRLLSGRKITLHGISLDRDTHRMAVNGAEVKLAPKLFNLLSVLMESAGRVMSREQLLDAVWGYDFFGDTRVVDTHINKLRKALGEAGRHITTVQGFGYRMEGEK
ncbi:MAG: response regulator transcription factor [Oscillospiraceae bacterium]|nr:response regulator transcription factor [Oscillospiraceae bacterium]